MGGIPEPEAEGDKAGVGKPGDCHPCLTPEALQLRNSARMLGGWDFPFTHRWAHINGTLLFTSSWASLVPVWDAKEVGPGEIGGLAHSTASGMCATRGQRRISRSMGEI